MPPTRVDRPEPSEPAPDATALNLERLFFLIILAPAMLLFFVVYGLFSRWTMRATGDPFVAGAANAAVFAVAIAVTFPMIAG